MYSLQLYARLSGATVQSRRGVVVKRPKVAPKRRPYSRVQAASSVSSTASWRTNHSPVLSEGCGTNLAQHSIGAL
jgi:hypothetical protein